MRKPPNEDWFGSIFTFCAWWGLIVDGILGGFIAGVLLPQWGWLLVFAGLIFGFVGGVWFSDRIREFIWRRPNDERTD
jgi:MFS family permease